MELDEYHYSDYNDYIEVIAMDYQSLYHKLFNACTDALSDIAQQNFGQAKERLIAAQQEAEEQYLRQTEEQAEP